MKRLAKSPKTAFRTGRGELGELGACARSASSSEDPSFVLRVRSTSCWRTAAICDAISVAFSGVMEAWRSEISFRQDGACAFHPPLLLSPLAGQERGRHAVGDRSRATGRVVGADDVDHVRVLVDARAHLVAQRVGGLSASPALRRCREQLPRRQQDAHRGQVALGRLSVRGRQRLGGRIEHELRGRLVRLGQEQRNHEHRRREEDDDRRDQPAAALERVEIAPDFDRIVRGKPRRAVSSNAFLPDSWVRHGS